MTNFFLVLPKPQRRDRMFCGMRVSKLGLFVVGITAFVLTFWLINIPSSVKPTVSLRKLLLVSIEVAERGGLEVKTVRESSELHEKSKGKTKEGANDPLTSGDLRSHHVMFNGLQKTFPRVKIISEEHDTKNKDLDLVTALEGNEQLLRESSVGDMQVPEADVTVWIDPLDATQEYTENLLQYVTTMVCIAVRGKPVIGVIHQPFEKKTVWAWVGHGYSSNVQASDTAAVQKPTIIVSRSHAGEVKDVAEGAFGSGTQVVPAGGAGYKTLQVVQGKADAYVHVTLIKKWDICAGNALLHALGGNMTTLEGDVISYSSDDDMKNKGGLLATLHHHSTFLEKLKNIKKN